MLSSLVAQATQQISDQVDPVEQTEEAATPLLSRSDPVSSRQQLALACHQTHRKFAEAFVRHGGDRAARDKAIIEVGYKTPRTQKMALKILSRPEVQVYVKYLMSERAKRDEISPDWIRARLFDEATFYGKGASHAARIKALELLGTDPKVGVFGKDAQTQVTVPVKVFIGIDPDKI